MHLAIQGPRGNMRELESPLQEFGEFLLKAQLVRPTAAPYFVRWVRRFLSRPASDEPLTDQVRGFCEELEWNGGFERSARTRTGSGGSSTMPPSSRGLPTLAWSRRWCAITWLTWRCASGCRPALGAVTRREAARQVEIATRQRASAT